MTKKSVVLGAFLLLFFSITIKANESNNRFLITKDFRANYHNWSNAYDGVANVNVSFKLENVSNGGISLILTKKQFRAFEISNSLVGRCEKKNSGAIPLIRSYKEESARREALYLPKGDSVYITIKAYCSLNKKNDKNISGVLKNGVISGRVTVIKGKRILTRPISGTF